MSAPADIVQEIVNEDNLWMIGGYTVTSAAALWLFDFIVTLPMEIEAVWTRKITGTGVVFLLNRYVYGISFMFQVIPQAPGSASDESCNIIYSVGSWLQITALMTTSLLFTLRIYALCGRSKVVICMASAMILVRLGYDSWQYVAARGLSTRGSPFSVFSRCTEQTRKISAFPQCMLAAFLAQLALIMYNWETAVTVAIALPLLFDSFIFIITLFKTYRHAREMHHLKQTTITDVILRDGILYFLVVFLLAVANFGLQLPALLKKKSATAALLSDILSPYFSVIQNLLISRLFLNLRAWNLPSSSTAANQDAIYEPNFAQNRFLGNIGAPLDPDWWNTQFDDDENALGGVNEVEPVEDSAATNSKDMTTTLVPVIYNGNDHETIEMVALHRQSSNAGPMESAHSTV